MGDFTYSDATDPNQALLFNAPSITPLAGAIAARFKGIGQFPVQRVEAYVIDTTAYLRKHMGEALLQLETDGKLQVAENKTDGKKRRAKTFPNEALDLRIGEMMDSVAALLDAAEEQLVLGISLCRIQRDETVKSDIARRLDRAVLVFQSGGIDAIILPPDREEQLQNAFTKTSQSDVTQNEPCFIVLRREWLEVVAECVGERDLPVQSRGGEELCRVSRCPAVGNSPEFFHGFGNPGYSFDDRPHGYALPSSL